MKHLKDLNNNRHVFIAGVVYILLFILSHVIRNTFSLLSDGSIKEITAVILNNILFVIVGLIVFIFFLKINYKQILQNKKNGGQSLLQIKYRSSDKKFFLIWSIILFFSWIPYFLAYYPGIFSYDVAGQIPMTLGSFTNWHPLVHTLYLKLFYNFFGETVFHNVNSGVALCTIVQMVIFSLMLSYVLLFLRRLSSSFKSILCCYVFYLLPFFSMMSISLTKDVFFAGFFVDSLICICYVCINQAWIHKFSNQLLLFFVIVGSILTRNTAVYIWAAFAILTIYQNIKKNNFRLLLIVIIATLFGYGSDKFLLFTLQATPVSYNDAYALPLQQISAVYNNHQSDMDAALKNEIVGLIPSVDNYYEYSADNIKVGSKLVSENRKSYINLYLSLLREYPLDMISSVFLLNQGYWYIPDISTGHVYNSNLEEGFGYYLTFTADGFGVVRHSYLPNFERFIERFFEYPNYDIEKIGPISVVFTLGIYLWIILFCFASVIATRNKVSYLPLLLVFILIGTVFLGPCVLIRYALPYLVSIPVVIRMVFNNTKSKKKIGREKVIK